MVERHPIVIEFGGYPEIYPFFPYQYIKHLTDDMVTRVPKRRPKSVNKGQQWRPVGRRTIKRHNIWVRDGKICTYCRQSITLKESTIDHIIPLSKGGKNNYDNLCIACGPCNIAKADMSVEEFKQLRRIQRFVSSGQVYNSWELD
jgi:5-methylcytosine-specific restriction endonuclease McrA